MPSAVSVVKTFIPQRLRQSLKRYLESKLTDASPTPDLQPRRLTCSISEWPKACSQWTTPAVTARLQQGLCETSTLEDSAARDTVDALKRTGITEGLLLDYGCGNSAYRDILHRDMATRGLRYAGADVNAELMRWCSARYRDNRFETLDSNAPSPFKASEFDVVLASGVLHLVEDYPALLREWYRVSRGYVLITRLPLRKYSPTGLWMVKLSHSWGEESYPARVMNRADFEGEVVAAGFEIVYRDYNDVFINHPGVSEPAVFHLYLLKKS